MDNFNATLQCAQQGDSTAIEQLLLLYEPLINRYSRIHGSIDEDLRQFIVLRILISLKFFQGNSKNSSHFKISNAFTY